MSPSSRLPKDFAALEKESKAGVSWPASTLSTPQSFHSQKSEGSGKAPLWVPELRPEGVSHNLGGARLAQICRKGGSSDEVTRGEARLEDRSEPKISGYQFPHP